MEVARRRRRAAGGADIARPGADARTLATGAAAAAAAAGAGVAIRALWREPRRTVVRELDLRLPRWPARYPGFRLAVVSDLHAGGPHVGLDRIERVVAETNALRPHLIALLGDYVDPEVVLGQRIDPEHVTRRLGALSAPLGTVAVLGNHDWAHDAPRIAGALRSAGIRVLENGAVRIARTPHELWVAGVADMGRRRPDVERALAAVPDDAGVLLLSHDPDVFPRVPARVALTVAGHTHGGQVNVPIARRRWVPSRHGERFADGHVVEGGRHLVVSRGIGTSRLPVRLGAPPEIVLLTLSGL